MNPKLILYLVILVSSTSCYTTWELQSDDPVPEKIRYNRSVIEKPISSILNDFLNDENETVLVLKDVAFNSGTFDIVDEEINELKEIAMLLIKNDNLDIVIEGHTDSQGGAQANLVLSTNRATVVQDFLLDFQINQERITAKGYGEARSKSDNNTAEGRKQNRRVEIIVFK